MASVAGQKPLILTAAEADHQRAEISARLAESRIKPLARSSLYPISYGLAALILLVTGFLLFSGNWTALPNFPTVVETVPSPDVNSTVAPAPLTPPVPQTAPPPADAPATNP